MKHLKYFEAKVPEYYCYFIPYDDIKLVRFAMEKFDIINTENIINEIKENVRKFFGVYLFINGIRGGFWTVNVIDDVKECERYIKDNGVEYRGEFKLEPHEIEAFNYNL
jgi:hypothetical protein